MTAIRPRTLLAAVMVASTLVAVTAGSAAYGEGAGPAAPPVVKQTVKVPGEDGGGSGSGSDGSDGGGSSGGSGSGGGGEQVAPPPPSGPPPSVSAEEKARRARELAELQRRCRESVLPELQGGTSATTPAECMGYAQAFGQFGAEAPPVDPAAAARMVVGQIGFPSASPVFGPDPKVNRLAPGKLVVGVPYWLTTPGDGAPIQTSGSAMGLTIQMRAVRSSVRFDMGDGESVRCARTTPWPGSRRGVDQRTGIIKSSPTCGHVFTERDTVTVQSVVSWSVQWSGGGQSGTIPVVYRGETGPLEVTEIETRVAR